MDVLLKYISDNNYGDFASVLGLAVTLIGFAITIYGVWSSRSAAERASIAANEAKQAVMRTEVISNFSSAVTAMEEVKRLHRAGAWTVVPDRYSFLRRTLISIVANHRDLSQPHKILIQSAVSQFRELESSVDTFLFNGKNAPSSAKLNKIVTAQMDKLDEVLNTVKTGSR